MNIEFAFNENKGLQPPETLGQKQERMTSRLPEIRGKIRLGFH